MPLRRIGVTDRDDVFFPSVFYMLETYPGVITITIKDFKETHEFAIVMGLLSKYLRHNVIVQRVVELCKISLTLVSKKSQYILYLIVTAQLLFYILIGGAATSYSIL